MALMSNMSLRDQTRRLSDTFHPGAALCLHPSRKWHQCNQPFEFKCHLLCIKADTSLCPWSFIREVPVLYCIFPVHLSYFSLWPTFPWNPPHRPQFFSLFCFFSLRCCRTAPRPAGKWSSTGGPHRVPTLCESSTSTRTSIRVESVC